MDRLPARACGESGPGCGALPCVWVGGDREATDREQLCALDFIQKTKKSCCYLGQQSILTFSSDVRQGFPIK